jgi:signal transduction histidine kinase
MSSSLQPGEALDRIRTELASIPEVQAELQTFRPGQYVLREGQVSAQVALVLEGQLDLLKEGDDASEYPVGQLTAGQFLGLLSLSSGEPAFLTARARTAVQVLTMPRERFAHLLRTRSDFNRLVAPLLLSNLVDRYRRVVGLHLEVAQLTYELNVEKLELHTTIQELQATRNRLIQKEKLATLGHLVSGIAHEINNPMASLSRAADSLESQLDRLFTAPLEERLLPAFKRAFELGLNRKSIQTEEQRRRSEQLQTRFPSLSRTVIRSLAQLEPDDFEELLGSVESEPKARRLPLLERLVDFLEMAVLLRSVRIASTRIGSIVRSLKNYSRQDQNAEEPVDLREGLQDTILLFGYVLKKFTVEVDLPPIPAVRCRPGEINQVWTNLILNACEAMGESGTLKVSCGAQPPDWVWVQIQDTGPGVSESLRNKIFDSHFSTKHGHQYGLGLGLAIAKGLVEKHHGRIEVGNELTGGAIFTVFLHEDPHPTTTPQPG